MKNSILIFACTMISMIACGSTNSSVQNYSASNWEKLGSKKVNFRLDKDVIYVGKVEGTFKKLKIEVTGGRVNMKKMVVEYKNGQKETIMLKNNFGPKSGSRVVDLSGKNRIIKDITFWYDSVNVPGRKATVHVFGKH